VESGKKKIKGKRIKTNDKKLKRDIPFLVRINRKKVESGKNKYSGK